MWRSTSSRGPRGGDRVRDTGLVSRVSDLAIDVWRSLFCFGGLLAAEAGAGDVLCVVRQMKTELEVRAGHDGIVRWVWEADVGEIVEGGELVCELSLEVGAKL